jgi:hypothetical protein
MGQRFIVIHADYLDGDGDGPYRDGRAGDVVISADQLRVMDGGVLDAYLQLAHDGYQVQIESSSGPIFVDSVEVASHVGRHLGGGEDSLYAVSLNAPTVSDDENDGYGIGSRWINVTDGYEYVCIDPSAGAAQWANTTAAGGGGGGVDPHASTHVLGGSDPIDADQLDIDFTPTNYTPDTSPSEVDDPDHLSAHLAGIDGYFDQKLGISGHRFLRHLIHFIDDGPALGFASGAFKETLPAGSPFPTSEIWYEDAGKTQKIVELTVTRNTLQQPVTEEWKMYDADGSTVLETVTDSITYSGVFEISRTRTIA